MLNDNNQFEKLGLFLAKTLEDKNRAYGNSYDQSVQTWGKNVMGIRIQDKCNRIQHLLLNNEDTENGESLAETFLDNAGYSLLAIRYMINHGMLSEEETKKMYDASESVIQQLVLERHSENN